LEGRTEDKNTIMEKGICANCKKEFDHLLPINDGDEGYCETCVGEVEAKALSEAKGD
jgi:rRNA maturation endonuclease Nob1